MAKPTKARAALPTSAPSPAIRADAPTNRTAPIILVVLVLLVFGRIVGHEFLLWDDKDTIATSGAMNPPRLVNLERYWTEEFGSLYIPVTYSIWLFLAFAAYSPNVDPLGLHLNPYIYHAASLLTHVATALVVYALLRRLVRGRFAPLLGAMVFAVHPVQVEAVAWASGYKDLLCGFFTLTAVWQYTVFLQTRVNDPEQMSRGTQCRPSTSPTGRAHYIIAVIAFALGTLSKPTAMVAPALCAVIDIGLVRRSPIRAIRALWPWVFLSIACAVWTKVVQPGAAILGGPMVLRPLIAADALAFYAGKLLWPLRLAIDYGRRPPVVIGMGWLYWTWIVPAAIALMLWRIRPSGLRRSLVTSAAFFIIGLAPVLGLTTFHFQFFSTVADHYLYISMAGIGLGIAAVAHYAAERFAAGGISANPQRVGAAVAGVIILLLAALSVRQAGLWTDDEKLNLHAIAVNPESTAGLQNLGEFYRLHGQLAHSRDLFTELLKTRPNSRLTHNTLALTLLAMNDDDGAIREIEAALDANSTLPPGVRVDDVADRRRLATVLVARGRPAEGAHHLEICLQSDPDNIGIQKELAHAQALATKRAK